MGRPDFGGLRPRGEALGKKKKGYGARFKFAAEKPCHAFEGAVHHVCDATEAGCAVTVPPAPAQLSFSSCADFCERHGGHCKEAEVAESAKSVLLTLYSV